MKPNIIYISNMLPRLGVSGSQNVSASLLSFLEISGFSITFLFVGQNDAEFAGWDDAPRSWQIYSSRFSVRDIPLLDLLPQKVRVGTGYWVTRARRGIERIANFPAASSRFALGSQKNHHSPPVASDFFAISDLCSRLKPVAVIVDYAWLAPLLDRIDDRSVLRVVLTHDLIFRRCAQMAEQGLNVDVPAWSQEGEAEMLRKADVLVIEKGEEVSDFEQMSPHSAIVVAPLAASVRQRTAEEILKRLMFVGSAAPHNIDGLLWFLQKVWPVVLGSNPDATLSVCGNVSSAIPEAQKNAASSVNWLGKVDDLAAEYGKAAVAIAPVLAGSGVKTKVIEALSYGVPVVATSEGAAGLLDSCAVLSADQPNEFATAISRLINDRDLRDSMSRSGKEYIERNHSPEVLYGELAQLIRRHSDPRPER